MARKDAIREALIEAEELERASMEAAKTFLVEKFTPNLNEFFADLISEADDKESDDDEDEFDADELEEGNEHDIGKEPDQGRLGTDAAVDDSEESLAADDKDDPMKEGQYDDVSGDATPEKNTAGRPDQKKNPAKKTKEGWEDEGSSGKGGPVPEKGQSAQPVKPSVKQTGDGGWEDEGDAMAHKDDPEENQSALPGGTPATKKDVVEAKGKKKSVKKEADDDVEDEKPSDDEEEFEVPDELFDDEEDLNEGSEDDVEISLDLDDEDEIDVEDLDEADDPEIEISIEDDDEDEEEEEDEPEDKGEEDLKKENRQLRSAINSLKEQMVETNLFNAKLAHLNKLFMSGAFTNNEKESIAERLDECEDIDSVKSVYKKVVTETKQRNPLDSFSSQIKEIRSNAQKPAQKGSVYESAEAVRWRQLAGLLKD